MAQNCYFCQSPPRCDVDIVGWRTLAGFKVQVGRPDILIGTNPRPQALKVETRGEMAIAQRAGHRSLKIALIFLLAPTAVAAQSVQFLPEVDSYLKINSMFRTYVEAKDDRDGGDSTQFTVGPSLNLYLKPLLKLKTISSFDLDDSKPRAVVLEAGYRSVTAPGERLENRFLASVTFHFPMKAAFLLTDRNRSDLDWKGGTFNWRYRNKLTLERTFAVASYHLIPYFAFEPFYESQYGKWSTTTEYAGCLLPVGKHVQFNPYYEHQNNTGSKHGNKPENFIGLAVYFFFSVENKGASGH